MGNNDDNLTQKRLRGRRYGEALGEELHKLYPGVSLGYLYNSLSTLTNGSIKLLESLLLADFPRYDGKLDPNKRVASLAVRTCISRFYSISEIEQLGKEHTYYTSQERSTKGVSARGYTPYINGKRILIDDKKLSEMEYIHYLRNKGKSWEEVVKKLSVDFYKRSIKGASAAYSRWRKKQNA